MNEDVETTAHAITSLRPDIVQVLAGAAVLICDDRVRPLTTARKVQRWHLCDQTINLKAGL